MKTLKNQFASRCELDVNRCELVNSSTGLGSGRGTIDPITVAEILEAAGIDPIKPQSEPVAGYATSTSGAMKCHLLETAVAITSECLRDHAASEQSSQAASESVTGEPSGDEDDGGRVKSSSDPTTIFVTLARNPGKK